MQVGVKKRFWTGLVVTGMMGIGMSHAVAQDVEYTRLLQAGRQISPQAVHDNAALFIMIPHELQDASIGETVGVLFEKRGNKVVKIADDVYRAQFAPDGRTIFYAQRSIYDVKEGQVRLVLPDAFGDFSFDKAGKRMVVTRPFEGDEIESNLEIVDMNGNVLNRLNIGGHHVFPYFTPDERQILFASGDTGIISWYVVNISGHGRRQLTNIGMEETGITDAFVPILSTFEGAGFIDDTHFKYIAEDEVWILDIVTGQAVKQLNAGARR